MYDVNSAADVNTLVIDVERVMTQCGGLRIVIGRLRHDDSADDGDDVSSMRTQQDSTVHAVFNQDTVSKCHIETGSVVAVHPPW